MSKNFPFIIKFAQNDNAYFMPIFSGLLMVVMERIELPNKISFKRQYPHENDAALFAIKVSFYDSQAWEKFRSPYISCILICTTSMRLRTKRTSIIQHFQNKTTFDHNVCSNIFIWFILYKIYLYVQYNPCQKVILGKIQSITLKNILLKTSLRLQQDSLLHFFDTF